MLTDFPSLHLLTITKAKHSKLIVQEQIPILPIEISSEGNTITQDQSKHWYQTLEDIKFNIEIYNDQKYKQEEEKKLKQVSILSLFKKQKHEQLQIPKANAPSTILDDKFDQNNDSGNETTDSFMETECSEIYNQNRVKISQPQSLLQKRKQVPQTLNQSKYPERPNSDNFNQKQSSGNTSRKRDRKYNQKSTTVDQ